MHVFVINNILAWSFIPMLWALDAYLFVVALRLALDCWGRPGTARLHGCLRQLTEPARLALRRWMAQCGLQGWPDWAVWGMVIVGLLLFRQMLLVAIVALSAPGGNAEPRTGAFTVIVVTLPRSGWPPRVA
jgi:uncharacterized protein YggT (Ycf19 family)